MRSGCAVDAQSHASELQVDCKSVERFPYQPSREESAIFEYVFFPQKSRAQKSLDGDANADDTKSHQHADADDTKFCTGPNLIRALPRFIAYILLLVNAGNITYTLVMSSLWNQSADAEGSEERATTQSEHLIAMAAIVEGVMLLSVIVKVVYFSVRLWASAGEYC